jgi:hypothetical protein
MKEPRKKLEVVWDTDLGPKHDTINISIPRLDALIGLAQAEAVLAVKSQSALSHFIAVVKEIEAACGFHFEEIEE